MNNLSDNDNKKIKEFLRCIYLFRKYSINDILFSDLSNAEFYALHTLWTLINETKEDSVRISLLGERLKLSPQAVSKSLRLLEQKKLIRRSTDTGDRRITLITFTKKGKEKLKEAHDTIAEFSLSVMGKMGEEEMKEFIRLGSKCIELMDETSGEILNKRKEKNE